MLARQCKLVFIKKDSSHSQYSQACSVFNLAYALHGSLAAVAYW